jgi:chromosomal replication initiator protein
MERGQGQKETPMSEDAIIQKVAEVLQVHINGLVGRTRTYHVSRARQIAMYALRKARPDFSLVAIGEAFGGRDHTTVMWAVQQVEQRAIDSSDFALKLVRVLDAVGVDVCRN